MIAMATPSTAKKAPSTLQYVAIGMMAPDGQPESLNTFDHMKDAAACAGEFVASHKFPSAAWVETVEVKPVTQERKPANHRSKK